MGNRAKRPQESDSGLRECKLTSCSVQFKPKTYNHEFCTSEHKAEHNQLIYEEGKAIVAGRGKMHAATLKSPQLHKALVLLSDGKPHTTKEVGEATGSWAPATLMSALKSRGCKFDSYIGKKGDKRVHFYVLESTPEGAI